MINHRARFFIATDGCAFARNPPALAAFEGAFFEDPGSVALVTFSSGTLCVEQQAADGGVNFADVEWLREERVEKRRIAAGP
jgi:hypothetical protein